MARASETRQEVASFCVTNIPGWDGLCTSDVAVTSSTDSEWHEVFFVQSARGQVVVNRASWSGVALRNKLAASRAASDSGIGPRLWCIGDDQRTLAYEYFEGGTLSPDDTKKPTIMAEVGKLFAGFHQIPTDWFDPVRIELLREKAVSEVTLGWEACVWVLGVLNELVPEASRTWLADHGVDWDFVVGEIGSLPQNGCLPTAGLTAQLATVHGDAHAGNIMHHQGTLRFIDFDMTSVGPAGADLGFAVLFLFGLTATSSTDYTFVVAPDEVQRGFATAYMCAARGGAPVTDIEVDDFLFDIQRWTYFGMLKMGLLCAVLMENDGMPQKREFMRKRGPVLLSARFLREAKRVLACAEEDAQFRGRLLREGLFYITTNALGS